MSQQLPEKVPHPTSIRNLDLAFELAAVLVQGTNPGMELLKG